MKKTWVAPVMETVEISATANALFAGGDDGSVFENTVLGPIIGECGKPICES